MEKVLHSLEELEAEAKRFVDELAPSDTGATLVTLSGELGAGKTSFTQAIARALGITEHITSPTFVLEKTYEVQKQNSFKRLVHIDAYRLTSGKDLQPLRFDERMKEAGSLIMLEWPEKVENGFKNIAVAITLSVLPDNTRSISYEK